MKQLLECLNKNDSVTAVKVNPDNDIKDFDAFEDTIYKRIESSTVNRLHLFYSDCDNKGIT